jgi:amino acid adenylation domain-containing protein
MTDSKRLYRLRIAADKKTKEKEYWLSKLAGEPAKSVFPIHYKSEGAKGTGKPLLATVNFNFSEELSSNMLKLCSGSDAKLHIVLVTGLILLIHKYTGSNNIIVGVPVYRVKTDAGPINTVLPLRARLVENMTFKQLLMEVQNTVVEADENRNYPMELLARQLNINTSLRDTDSALFDTAILVENIHDKGYLSRFRLNMILSFVRKGNTIRGYVEYNVLLYDRNGVEGIIGHFKNLLQAALFTPDEDAARLEILTEEEKHQLLYEFNETAADYPRDKTIHEFFERQVEKTPDYVAVIGSWQGVAPPADKGAVGKKEEMHITYGILNEKADQMAHSLRDKGLLSDSIIGIMTERSIKMVVGILGILKAGGAYLPIDPEYPQERIDYMLKDSGAKLLVTTNNLEAPDFPLLPATGHRPPAASLAYIIYTSGSTGKPKGVMVHHQAVVNILFGLNKRYPFGEHDVYLLKTAVMFDVSVTELFGWFMGAEGGRLAILERGAEKSPQGILDTVYRHRVTHLNFVPSMFNAFVEILDSRDIYKLAYLRYIFLAGEKLWAEPVKAFQCSDTNVLLENLYGPTEAAVYASGYSLSDWNGKDDIPIGKPLDNIELYILDRQGNLVPLGVSGELYISGDGLARGYLNNPGLTAERFDDCSFYRSYKSYRTYIFYKTGDLARWLPEGNIEFIGRIDQQVKIRGFRIEPGEIESQLLAHDEIKEAIVIAREDQQRIHQYLCAYFVPVRAEELSPEDLREYLSGRLPDYMIPSYFVQLEAIPLTPNGKVDREALPEMELKAGKGYAAPRDEIEKKLVEIWCEVLGIEEGIGIDDNFFKRGGHSLKATVMASRIHRELNKELPLEEIFRLPTIRGMGEYIKGVEVHEYISIKPVEKRDFYALSPSQKRLYILQQMEPGNTGYNMPLVMTLVGGLERDRFEEVFRQLIARHESLRTSFIMTGEEPVQRIHDDVGFEVEYYDVEQHTPVYGRVESFIRAFDLTHAPLLRVGLIHTPSASRPPLSRGDDTPALAGHPSQEGIPEAKHILMIDMHHIISDGTSSGILTTEFMTLYAGEVLPSLILQYKDFSLWQNELFETAKIKAQEKYWLDQFNVEIPVLNLPMDYPRPVIRSFEGDTLSFEIGTDETKALRALALKEETTLFMLLLSIYCVLLAKLSGQDDIIVGTPTAGRRHADLQQIIGMFVNTLALRSFPTGEKSFNVFMKEVKGKAIASFENQDYQFEDLVEKVAVNRDAGRNPLFDVVFALQNLERTKIKIPNLELEPYKFKTNISKFDITLQGYEAEQALIFTVEYSTKLFKPETVRRLIDYLVTLVRQVCSRPDIRISEIEMLAEEEKHRLVYEFNDTAAPYPEERTIHGLFEEQMEKTPDSVAVVGKGHGCMDALGACLHGDISITFRELNEKSNQLAHLLRIKGVGPDTIVGIMGERSIEMIIGILGILKAGGAYLPIDPEYPQERIDYMLKDSGAKLSVTTNNLEAPDSPLLPATGHRPPATYLAYVIYTSGTSGRPKGVLIGHASLVNFCYSMYRDYSHDFGPPDNCLSLTNICFDVSVCEIFMPLIFGASIVLLPFDKILDPAELAKAIVEKSITFTYLPPGLLNEVFENLKSSGCKVELNKMLVGVEPIRDYVLENYAALNPSMRIVNGYGPTEATICATAYRYRSHEPVGSRVPIGVPLANMQVLLLDKYDRLVPVGVPAELCIAGDGLARGYLNHLELTAERFLSVFYRSYRSYRTYIPSKKIYKTGDLARRLPDGNIEFIGRIDQQVKIRGFRIEPGEVENQLLTHDEIKEVIVVAKEDQQKIHKYLCAYFVPARSGDLSSEDLREYLSGRLPDYMIPSHFIPLDKIPLTPNGKVDRKALPEPEFKAGENHIAPRNEIEKKLVSIWSGVLGIEGSIGIDDNFFELGGHSLKATLMAARIHKALNKKVPLAEIFRIPTVRELAEYIRKTEMFKYVSIAPVERRDFYALSSAQKRLYILQQMEPGNTGYNMPIMLTLEGSPDKDRFKAAFKQLIARHESLRTSFIMAGEEPVQRVRDEVEFEVEYYEVERHTPVYVRVESFIRAFDLSRAPLLRVGLLHTPTLRGGTHPPQEGITEAKHLLMIDMHHIISDGVSLGILTKEFMALYAGDKLPRLRIQYRDFSLWQNRLFETGKIKSQEKYWGDQFSGEIPVLNLPMDYPRPSTQSFEGDTRRFEIGKEDTKALRSLALKEGTTLFMLLLALYNVLLSRLGGQEDIIVGTPIAGRRHADLQKVIGMFINTLALRNFPSGEKPFQTFLKEVKEGVLEAFENQDYPFEDLVGQVAINRDVSRNPLFDVMFALQDFTGTGIEIPGLKLKPYEFKTHIAKFDVTLLGYEAGQTLIFTIEYSTRLFNPETIRRFIDYLLNLVRQVCSHPGIRISEIDMLTEEEKHRLVCEFNDTAAPYPEDRTIHDLFEEQVEKTPDSVAVIGKGHGCMAAWLHGNISISFIELNEKADRLAYLLGEKGVLADDIVGIKATRSIEMIIGILGILKAGGAYLPIDPEYPQERINYMLKDSGAKLLITASNLEVPDFSLLPATGSRQPATSLAYIIYTSGTTGQPKGVAVEHRSLVNLCSWHNRNFGVTSADRAAKYAGFGFDASVWEIFPYLVCGASLYIVEDEIKLDVDRLNEYFERHDITISFLPTQICEQFMGLESAGSSLRILLTGGDKLRDFVKRDYCLVNNYGPTENTVVTTSFIVEESYANIPIGKPVSNNQVYILARGNYLQPMGVPGELYISGDGLARGYLNNPELTAERFLSVFYRSYRSYRTYFPSKKIYKTGDLARWLPGGNIEFLGRLDTQVKIRGFRIELGEIESQLLRHGEIDAVVVLLKEAGLCGCVVSRRELPASELRDYLAKILPAYMIPSYFIRVDKIPLTPHGKVDRKALPEPDSTHIPVKQTYAAPGTDMEKMVADAWKEVLKLDKVGINDSFFDLGGNSLDFIKVKTKLKIMIGREVPVVDMFRYPTVSLLANYLSEGEMQLTFSNEKIDKSIDKMGKAVKIMKNRRNR